MGVLLNLNQTQYKRVIKILSNRTTVKWRTGEFLKKINPFKYTNGEICLGYGKGWGLEWHDTTYTPEDGFNVVSESEFINTIISDFPVDPRVFKAIEFNKKPQKEVGGMTFNQLKMAMESFGLWEKVRGFYRKDGRIHDFDALEEGIKKYSTSERALILAFTDLYHGRNTIYFNELIQCLDNENIFKLIQVIRQLKGVKISRENIQ